MDRARYVEKVAILFGRILANLQLDCEAEGKGLTESQREGMSYLYRHGRLSVGEIAKGLGTTHPAAVRLIGRLKKKGLVHQTQSDADRRVSIVELTDAGRELIERLIARRTEILAESLSNIQPEELENVMRGLEALLAGVLANSQAAKSVCLKCGEDHIGCCIVNRAHFELTGSLLENN